MKKVKWMKPKVDFVFKRIFGAEANKDILLHFLNATLRDTLTEELTEIVLVDPHINPDAVDDKKSILDVRAKTAAGIQINVEIQLSNEYNSEKRTLYYWAKMYEEQLSEGQDYGLTQKAVTINIVDFNFLDTAKYHSLFRIREETEGFLLTEDLEIHFLELPKLTVEDGSLGSESDKLIKWLLFLKADSQTRLEEVAMSEPMIRKAVEILEFLNQDTASRRLYEAREKALKDEVSMINGASREGEKRGRKKEKSEIAQNMLKEGYGLVAIAEVTGLSIKELEQMKQTDAK